MDRVEGREVGLGVRWDRVEGMYEVGVTTEGRRAPINFLTSDYILLQETLR